MSPQVEHRSLVLGLAEKLKDKIPTLSIIVHCGESKMKAQMKKQKEELKKLKANGLKEVEKIIDVNSKLIVNRSSYKTKTKKIDSIINQINKIIS